LDTQSVNALSLGLPADKVARLQQRIGMRDVRLGRWRNGAGAVELCNGAHNRVAGLGCIEFFAKRCQRFNDLGTEVIFILEIRNDEFLADAILQRF
jgi:hypothetical protein